MRRALALLLLYSILPLFAADAEPASSAPPPPEEAAPSVPESISRSERISVDFPNEEVRTILRNVADLYELNLVVPETLQGRTSIKLRNVTWRQIFRETLAPMGYTFIEDENIVRVVSFESLDRYRAGQSLDSRVEHTDSGTRIRPVLFLALAPLGVVRIVFFFVVLSDKLGGPPRFLPRWLWAFVTLLGGVLPLLAYWLMHHSNLAVPPVLPSIRQSEPRTPM